MNVKKTVFHFYVSLSLVNSLGRLISFTWKASVQPGKHVFYLENRVPTKEEIQRQ